MCREAQAGKQFANVSQPKHLNFFGSSICVGLQDTD